MANQRRIPCNSRDAPVPAATSRGGADHDPPRRQKSACNSISSRGLEGWPATKPASAHGEVAGPVCLASSGFRSSSKKSRGENSRSNVFRLDFRVEGVASFFVIPSCPQDETGSTKDGPLFIIWTQRDSTILGATSYQPLPPGKAPVSEKALRVEGFEGERRRRRRGGNPAGVPIGASTAIHWYHDGSYPYLRVSPYIGGGSGGIVRLPSRISVFSG